MGRHGLRVPRPRHLSSIRDDSGERRRIDSGFHTDESFPASYEPADEDFDDLVFALKYDGVDLCVLSQCFRHVDQGRLAARISERPTSKYGRRLFFLFELLTDERLAVADLSGVAYCDVLDAADYFVGAGIRRPRYRVVDNLLGTRSFCPIVRKTDALRRWAARDLPARAAEITGAVDPLLLARAISYLYTKETKSSFAIEREDPGDRTQRFANQLATVALSDLHNEAALVALQNEIVQPPYREHRFRESGDPEVYVGQTVGAREHVHHVGARSSITQELMDGWSRMRPVVAVSTGPKHGGAPVVEAACRSFSFVFIHPFGDGNGRIHRLLLHSVLARRAYFPRDLVVPISAVLLRSHAHYDQVLEDFSQRVMSLVKYTLDENGEITLHEAPDDAYRYPDLTPQCEATFGWIERALEEDLVQELAFLRSFDEIRERVRAVIEMPDRREQLFIKLCLQNNGRLAKGKRRLFLELDDQMIERLESAVLAALTLG